MLNAEHVALESRLVSQMVNIRQREMDVLLERYTAIGTQAALLSGFAISQLTGVDPSTSEHVGELETYFFYTTSLTCVLSSMHVVMCTMYICNWAPRLALRGPTGSISRAYGATRSEKRQINGVFTLGTISFAMQTVMSIWILDEVVGITVHCIYATVITVSLVAFDMLYHRRSALRGLRLARCVLLMCRTARRTPRCSPVVLRAACCSCVRGGCVHTVYQRFFGKAGEWSTRKQRQAVKPRATVTILNNPLAHVDNNPDAIDGELIASGEILTAQRSEMNHEGALSKRSLQPGEPGAAGHLSSITRLATSVAGEWRERYFVLKDGSLNYWRSQNEYDAGKPAALETPIDLRGYEVLVDTDSPKWAFAISPIVPDGRRTWHLRAPSDKDRLVWARKLLLSTYARSEE